MLPTMKRGLHIDTGPSALIMLLVFPIALAVAGWRWLRS